MMCDCYRCTMELVAREPFQPDGSGGVLGMIDPRINRMILCATCGNKRCPHAADHRNACTGSNEPGQKGSLYEDALIPPAEENSSSRTLPPANTEADVERVKLLNDLYALQHTDFSRSDAEPETLPNWPDGFRAGVECAADLVRAAISALSLTRPAGGEEVDTAPFVERVARARLKSLYPSVTWTGMSEADRAPYIEWARDALEGTAR